MSNKTRMVWWIWVGKFNAKVQSFRLVTIEGQETIRENQETKDKMETQENQVVVTKESQVLMAVVIQEEASG